MRRYKSRYWMDQRFWDAVAFATVKVIEHINPKKRETMKVELDGKEWEVIKIKLSSELLFPDYFKVSALILASPGEKPKCLKSKSVFTKNATIEDIIKDTWEDNQE